MRLSFSAVQKFIKCPKMYNLHYNLRIREKMMGSALLFGTAIDDALNVMLKDREAPLENVLVAFGTKWAAQEVSGKLEPLATSHAVTYYNGDFDVDVLSDEDVFIIFENLKKFGYEFDHQNLDQLHKELCAAKREKRFGTDEKTIFNYLSWYSLLRKGEMILTAYREQILPRIKRVIDVQKYFSISNEVQDELIGFIDMICEWEDGRIIRFDHKTSAKKYKDNGIGDNAVIESEQLATYTLATEEQWKEKTAGFIVFEKSIRKRDPRVRIQVIIDEIPLTLEDKVLEQYDSACERIKNQEFPANLSSCEDEKGFRCPYYNFCHGNGDMTGLIKLDKSDKKS
jgi:hypothetical protein